MRPLTSKDIVGLERYARDRQTHLARILELKRHRRVDLGDRFTLLFENRDTVWFQIQEMIWIERIADAREVRKLLDIYNAQVPGDGELSATLLIALKDQETIRTEIDSLRGVDRSFYVQVGARPRIAGLPEEGRSSADLLSTIQYLRFSLADAEQAAFADPSIPVRVGINHTVFRHEVELPADVRAALLADLQCGTKRPSAPAGPSKVRGGRRRAGGPRSGGGRRARSPE